MVLLILGGAGAALAGSRDPTKASKAKGKTPAPKVHGVSRAHNMRRGVRGTGKGGAGAVPARKPGPLPRVVIGKPTVGPSGYPMAFVRRVVRIHLAQIRSCYKRGLERHPGLKGQVSVTFTIGPGGRVSAVSVFKDTLATPNVGLCLVRSIRRWRFPRPKGGGAVNVRYPFNFSTAGAFKPTSRTQREIIRDMVRRHQTQIRRCYLDARGQEPGLGAGKILVLWTIDREGHVTAARTEKDTLKAPRIGKCLVRLLLSWTFPPTRNGGVVKVRYPFTFKP